MNPDDLLKRLEGSMVDELIVLSISPSCFSLWKERDYSNKERLDNLMEWCSYSPRFHPVHWIDPTEEDAVRQVDEAVERGIQGFKVICSTHYPGDPRAMKAYRKMAEHGKSVMFHSGILWDGKASSRYNRPVEFEDLIDIKGLKFAIAHISWPWTDECIAVYGKYQNAWKDNGVDCARMYVDITPGTPPIYRKEALTRLLLTGYDMEDNIFFGSDCTMHDYQVNVCEDYAKRDLEIYRALNLPERVIKKFFSENVKKFYGIE